jgi:hypothetical protein
VRSRCSESMYRHLLFPPEVLSVGLLRPNNDVNKFQNPFPHLSSHISPLNQSRQPGSHLLRLIHREFRVRKETLERLEQSWEQINSCGHALTSPSKISSYRKAQSLLKSTPLIWKYVLVALDVRFPKVNAGVGGRFSGR